MTLASERPRAVGRSEQQLSPVTCLSGPSESGVRTSGTSPWLAGEKRWFPDLRNGQIDPGVDWKRVDSGLCGRGPPAQRREEGPPTPCWAADHEDQQVPVGQDAGCPRGAGRRAPRRGSGGRISRSRGSSAVTRQRGCRPARSEPRSWAPGRPWLRAHTAAPGSAAGRRRRPVRGPETPGRARKKLAVLTDTCPRSGGPHRCSSAVSECPGGARLTISGSFSRWGARPFPCTVSPRRTAVGRAAGEPVVRSPGGRSRRRPRNAGPDVTPGTDGKRVQAEARCGPPVMGTLQRRPVCAAAARGHTGPQGTEGLAGPWNHMAKCPPVAGDAEAAPRLQPQTGKRHRPRVRWD